jgi:hypothetical protein
VCARTALSRISPPIPSARANGHALADGLDELVKLRTRMEEAERQHAESMARQREYYAELEGAIRRYQDALLASLAAATFRV